MTERISKFSVFYVANEIIQRGKIQKFIVHIILNFRFPALLVEKIKEWEFQKYLPYFYTYPKPCFTFFLLYTALLIWPGWVLTWSDWNNVLFFIFSPSLGHEIMFAVNYDPPSLVSRNFNIRKRFCSLLLILSFLFICFCKVCWHFGFSFWTKMDRIDYFFFANSKS